jgi:hypothetical protein
MNELGENKASEDSHLYTFVAKNCTLWACQKIGRGFQKI